MKNFKQFIHESISPSRTSYLKRNAGQPLWSREDTLRKHKQPEMSDEEKNEHVNKTFNSQLLKKVRKSHDPTKPIDLTSKLPEDVKALGRNIIYHFEQGIRKKEEAKNKQFYPNNKDAQNRFNEGHHMIRIARHAMRTHLGDHFAQLLPHNESREVLRKLFAKESNINEAFDWTERTDVNTKKGRYKEIRHTSVLPSGHKLVVLHRLNLEPNERHLETDFGFENDEGDIEMDTKHVDPPVPREHTTGVFATVKKSIEHMIKEHGITHVLMQGNNKDKHNLYRKYAENLAKKYGGTVSSSKEIHRITLGK